MTAQEAIECIEGVLTADINYDESLDYQLTSDDIDWLNTAKEAIKKQIPKKPYYPNEYQIKCSVCGRFVIDGQPYCDECGQALDWSDIHEKIDNR